MQYLLLSWFPSLETKIHYAAPVEWVRWWISEKAMSIVMHNIFDTVKQNPDITLDEILLKLKEGIPLALFEPRKKAHLRDFLKARFWNMLWFEAIESLFNEIPVQNTSDWESRQKPAEISDELWILFQSWRLNQNLWNGPGGKIRSPKWVWGKNFWRKK